MVRRLLGEASGVIERQVTVHLVRRDVVVAYVIFATRLEQAVRAFNVRAQEGLGVSNGVVVVALCRVVHDSVMPRDDAVEQLGVADVAHHQLHAVFRQAGDVLRVAGVGEFIEHRRVHIGAVVDHVVDKVAANEAATARDDDIGGVENLLSHDACPKKLTLRFYQHY